MAILTKILTEEDFTNVILSIHKLFLNSFQVINSSPSHPLVIVFGASWCKNCNKLVELIDSDPEISRTEIDFFKIDLDEHSELGDLYNVSVLPTSILFSSGVQKGLYIGSDYDSFKLFIENSTSSSTQLSIQPEYPLLSSKISSQSLPKLQLSNGSEFVRGLPSPSLLSDLLLSELSSFLESNPHHSPLSLYDELPRDSPSSVPLCEPSLEVLTSLFQYRVPTISPGGTCSNLSVLASEPFDLSQRLYGLPPLSLGDSLSISPTQTHPQVSAHISRLLYLRSVVSFLQRETGAEWIGIYRTVLAQEPSPYPCLVKESYTGEPSRALFPVTSSFSEGSSNSWVGLRGRARAIQNTRDRGEGVGYYECSGKVRSELCVPVLRRVEGGEGGGEMSVIGIIDLESWTENHFSPSIVLQVLRTAFELGEMNLCWGEELEGSR